MNSTRRKFFGSLASAVLGCYIAVGVKPSLLKIKSGGLNSEWVNSEYEVHFAFGKDAFSTFKIGPPPVNSSVPVVFKRNQYNDIIEQLDKFPIRMDKDGNVINPLIS